MSEPKIITDKTEKMITVYNIATKYLALLGKLPYAPKETNARGRPKILGPFIPVTQEIVMETIPSLSPRDWYKEATYNGEKIHFEDLLWVDQEDLNRALEAFRIPSATTKELEQKCFACWDLFITFFDKQKEVLASDELFKKHREAK